jgi:TonB family protein
MKKIILVFLVVISSAVAQAQRGTWENGIFILPSELTKLDGEWYSNQWKYGYTLTNGVGVATSTNSPNFKVGDRIIFLQQSSDKTFEGTQVYTDGKFYKITAQLQSNDTLLFKGEKNISWTMTKKTQTTAQAAPSTTSTNAQATTSTTLATPSPNVNSRTMKDFSDEINNCIDNNRENKLETRGFKWQVLLRVYLETNGVVSSVEVINPSSSDLDDNRTVIALKKCSPFPKPPNQNYPKYVDVSYTYPLVAHKNHTNRNTDSNVDKVRDNNTLPPCYGTDASIWNACIGTKIYPPNTNPISPQQNRFDYFDRTYTGEFRNGVPDGSGVQTRPDGRKFIGTFKNSAPNGKGTVTFPDGTKYSGEFKDGFFDGFGIYELPNNNKYVGEFKDNKFNGKGTYTHTNGVKYVGDFKDGKRNGLGTFTSSNGDKYVGEYKDDARNGQGTYTFANGDKYVCEFKDDDFNGLCTIIFANGDKYAGEYKDGKANGTGTMIEANGVKKSGNWANGFYLGTNASNNTVTSDFADKFEEQIYFSKNEEKLYRIENDKMISEFPNFQVYQCIGKGSSNFDISILDRYFIAMNKNDLFLKWIAPGVISTKARKQNIKNINKEKMQWKSSGLPIDIKHELVFDSMLKQYILYSQPDLSSSQLIGLTMTGTITKHYCTLQN